MSEEDSRVWRRLVGLLRPLRASSKDPEACMVAMADCEDNEEEGVGGLQMADKRKRR